MNKYGLNNELLSLLKEFPDKEWNYSYLSCNPNITIKDIKENLDKNWDYNGLSYNPNITMKDVKLNPDKEWNYFSLSRNLNITIKDVKENPDIKWDYDYLSRNKFNCDIIVTNRLLKERLKFNSDDLLKCIEDIKYRPGNNGYINAMNEFNKLI